MLFKVNLTLMLLYWLIHIYSAYFTFQVPRHLNYTLSINMGAALFYGSRWVDFDHLGWTCEGTSSFRHLQQVVMDVSSFQNPFSGYKTVLRFTMIAEDIIMKIEAAKVYGDEEYDKRVSVLMLSLLQSIFSVYKLFYLFHNFHIFRCCFWDSGASHRSQLVGTSLWTEAWSPLSWAPPLPIGSYLSSLHRLWKTEEQAWTFL